MSNYNLGHQSMQNLLKFDQKHQILNISLRILKKNLN